MKFNKPNKKIDTKKFSIIKTAKGLGLFSKIDFKKGELLFIFHGERYKYDEIKDDSYIDHHCVQISKNTYLGPCGTEGDFINHSCNPNSGVKEITKDNLGIFAIKNISAGEEITFDYSTSMDENHSEYECLCNTKNCRGKIRDFKLLPYNIQRKYLKLGIVLPFISRQYKKFSVLEN